jgi:DNA-binding MurR/RpiR family transcriptional regulator
MAGSSVEIDIHDAMHRLTAAERRAARGLLANYPALGLGPVADFARESGASPATVLRFVAQLGFASYPDFQRRLRDELDERMKSPLQRPHAGAVEGGRFLESFFERAAQNLRETVARIPASEFEAVCQLIASPRARCHIVGGRFTDAIASYLTAHLRIVRPGVLQLASHATSRVDQLIDIKAGDTAVIFDIRRYNRDMTRIARLLSAQRANVVLLTDTWISPVSRHAKFVLPAQIGSDRTWDSSTALFALSEAIIARATEISWASTQARMTAVERLHGEADAQR